MEFKQTATLAAFRMPTVAEQSPKVTKSACLHISAGTRLIGKEHGVGAGPRV